MRGMAAEECERGQGCGRALVDRCAEYVRTQGGTSIWCNARASAIGFYARMGFEAVLEYVHFDAGQ